MWKIQKFQTSRHPDTCLRNILSLLVGEKGLLLRQYNNTVWCPSTICGAINYLCCPVWHLSLHVRPDQQERDMCSFNLVHQFDGHFFGLDSQLKGKKKVESSQNHLQSKVKNTYISFGHIHKSSLQQETTYTVLLSPFFTSYNCPYSVVERKSCTCWAAAVHWAKWASWSANV